MKRKRNIIVDKEFQVKMAFSFTSVVILTFTIFIVIILYMSLNYSRKLDVVVNNQKSLSENQSELFKTLMSFSRSKELKNFHISDEDVSNDMTLNNAKLEENISIIKNINITSLRFVISLIALVLLQSLFLFYIIIRRSHRISGPIFILNRYIGEIKTGKFPEIRPLRPKDDFKKLFDNFREMVEYLKSNR
jgi:nitrogen fixation/metabolism regulation signal transduction histidine kinase